MYGHTMAEDDPRGTFICSDCGAQAAEGGNCRACGQGPLLDLADPAVLPALREADVQRRLKRARQLQWVSIPIAVALGLVAATFAWPVLALIPLPVPFANVIKVVALMVLIAFGVSKALVRALPAKQLAPDGDAPTASTTDVAAAMRRGSSRRLAIAVGALVGAGLLLGGGAAWMKAQERAARGRASAALSALGVCLVGRLDAGESLPARVRRIQLSEGAVAPSPDWPARCARHGDALFAELPQSGPGASLRDMLASKAGCAAGCRGEGLSAAAREILGAGTAAGLRDVPGEVTEGEPGPPLAAMSLLTAKDFAALGPADLQALDAVTLADGTAALLYKTPGSELQVCEVDVGAGTAACGAVPPGVKVAPASAKLAQGEQEPVIYGITRARVTGGRDALGHRRSPDDSDEPQKTEVERGAFLARSGERAELYHGDHEGLRRGHLLQRDGEAVELITVRDGQEAGREKLRLSKRLAGPWVVDESILYTAYSGDGERELFVRSAAGGSARSLGKKVGASGEPPLVCRAGETSAVIVGKQSHTQVSFLKNGTLSALAGAGEAKRVGAEPPKPPPPPEVEAPADSSAAPAGSGSARYAVRGPADNPDPYLARQQALKDATDFGLLGRALKDGDGISGMFGSGGLGLGSSKASARPRREGPPLPRTLSAAVDGADVSCSEGSATRTWVVESGELVDVHQVRCAEAGCSHEYTKIRGLVMKNLWLATDLGGKALLVFRGPLGDLRMRMAPLAELATAPDEVIMDSAEHGGAQTGESRVLVGAGAVVVLFRGGPGLHGLRIGADGHFGVVRAG